MRNQSSGGYSQQGYQARTPTNYAQQQQPGYGYVQPGAYPGPPQYNQPPPPPPYYGYPPQNQQATYDYYNQQQQQQQQTEGGATNGSNYGYSQAQGQAYGQDGYGGYQAPSNPAAVYNPTPDAEHTQGETNQTAPPGQSYNVSNYSHQTYGTQAPPSYPSYGTAQPNYAQPPGAQYAHQTSYPPPSSDSTSAQQRPPPPTSGYATSQTGYGGAPPYNTAYGGDVYSQSQDATPPQVAPHPSGAAKASPPS